MQETKGCCEKCKVIPLYAVPPAYNCFDASCSCHNSSDAFIEEMEESMSRLQEVAKKQGANEFKQKVLEVLPESVLDNMTVMPGFEKSGQPKTIRTVISNLEV